MRVNVVLRFVARPTGVMSITMPNAKSVQWGRASSEILKNVSVILLADNN